MLRGEVAYIESNDVLCPPLSAVSGKQVTFEMKETAN
jgi:hypothetical protein